MKRRKDGDSYPSRWSKYPISNAEHDTPTVNPPAAPKADVVVGAEAQILECVQTITA